MSEREDYKEPGPDMPGLGTVVAAVGRAFLFAAACGMLCLIVIELGFGYNMYFAPARALLVSCYTPAGLAGLMYFGFTARR